MAKEVKEDKTNKTKEEVISEGTHKKKSLLCMIGGIVLIVVLIVVGCFMFLKKGGQEASLSKSLESMGKDFYENFYYTQVGSTDEERANFLSKYETIGIKINLDNLSRYDNNKNSDKINKFVNNKIIPNMNKSRMNVVVLLKPLIIFPFSIAFSFIFSLFGNILVNGFAITYPNNPPNVFNIKSSTSNNL